MFDVDAYWLSRDVTGLLAFVAFAAQSEPARDVWGIAVGMLRDYRHRLHAREMAKITGECYEE